MTPELRAVLAADFRPEQVAPVIVALVHESCPFTEEVIGAAGRHVSRMYVAQTTGAQVSDELTPEEVIERLPDVWDESGAQAMGLVNPGERGSGTPVTVMPPEAVRRDP